MVIYNSSTQSCKLVYTKHITEIYEFGIFTYSLYLWVSYMSELVYVNRLQYNTKLRGRWEAEKYKRKEKMMNSWVRQREKMRRKRCETPKEE